MTTTITPSTADLLEELRAAEQKAIATKIAAQGERNDAAREEASRELAAIRARIEELERKAAEPPRAVDVDASKISYGRAVATQEGLVCSAEPPPLDGGGPKFGGGGPGGAR